VHHIQGCDRNQTLLLPNSVDDYIGPDNPVRFIEAFVEQVDLRGAGFRRSNSTMSKNSKQWRRSNTVWRKKKMG